MSAFCGVHPHRTQEEADTCRERRENLTRCGCCLGKPERRYRCSACKRGQCRH